MSVNQVRSYLDSMGCQSKIIEFSTSSATVELAALALGCEEGRIAKTLSFLVNDNVILILTAGDQKIDNAKYRHHFNTKAKMLEFSNVLEKVGHPVGGVCPFAIHEGIDVYLDVSLKKYETVFPAAGSENSAIELKISELFQFSKAKEWIDVCKERIVV